MSMTTSHSQTGLRSCDTSHPHLNRSRPRYSADGYDPEQDKYERSGRSIGRGDAAGADIQPDQGFSDGEQNGGDGGSQPEIPPGNPGVRERPVDDCEQNRE